MCWFGMHGRLGCAVGVLKVHQLTYLVLQILGYRTWRAWKLSKALSARFMLYGMFNFSMRLRSSLPTCHPSDYNLSLIIQYFSGNQPICGTPCFSSQSALWLLYNIHEFPYNIYQKFLECSVQQKESSAIQLRMHSNRAEQELFQPPSLKATTQHIT